MLLQQLRSLLDDGWGPVFSQHRTCQRAIDHAIALPCVLGRRTISRTLCVMGRTDQDWSADYKMYSRSDWDADSLFGPVFDEYLIRYTKGLVATAIDDTKLRKTGRRIKTASWHRDPLSPPFHMNLLFGLRFLQASLLFPHYDEADCPPRGIPVRFQESPPIKKPGKRATPEQIDEYKNLKKIRNLSVQTLEMIRGLRLDLDHRGAADRILLPVMDGSFCNKTMFRADLDRVHLLARCRKDARLCFPAPPGGRLKYDPNLFTPEQVRKQQDRPWRQTNVYIGGKWRPVRYKEIKQVLWKRGAQTKPLRLLIIAPVPYKLSKNSRKTNYREPAYFLSTDLTSMARRLILPCFDRWQIEVNHRDEKDILGVGQAQVRSLKSVPRHPALAVASYSMTLIAALRQFGPTRTTDYLVQPKWRSRSKRPSFLDILTRLRKDVIDEASASSSTTKISVKNLTSYADT
jgi:hypothetical protein